MPASRPPRRFAAPLLCEEGSFFLIGISCMSTVTRSQYLLITDLDGTLIPPEWGDELRATMERFARLVSRRDDVLLTYATGRDIGLALQGIGEHGLPEPQVLISEVGSAIYHCRDGAFHEDPEYRDLMESAFGAGLRDRVPERMSGMPGVEAQEASKQGRFKVSFYVAPDLPEARVRAMAAQALGPVGSEVSLVFSIDPADGGGLLDVIPAGVSKASAAHYLRERLGFRPEEVIYAGDNGNDTAALLAGFNAILVGNASGSLRSHLAAESRRRGLEDRLYCAEAAYVSGVLEGCARFGLL